MRIGLISQWYPPEGVFIPGNLARQLAGRGHEVKVLTTFPSYPYGRVFPGWRQRWRHRETEGPVMVRRVPAYPSHDTSTVRRALSHLSFGATSAVAGARWLADVDVTYVYHPPPTAVAAAALQRAARRTPIVLHVQDLWPESVTQSGMAPTGRAGRWLERSIGALMRGTYRLADAIVVISPTMAERVVAGGADPDRVRVVWNWTDDALFRPVPVTDEARAVLGHRQRCTVMFAGNLGLLQGIETAIRAAAAASDRMDLVLVGSGAGEDGARRLAADLGADNVRFIGRRPPEQMAELYAAAQLATFVPARRTRPARRRPVEAAGRVGLRCSGDRCRGRRHRRPLSGRPGSVSSARQRTGGRSPKGSWKRPTSRPPRGRPWRTGPARCTAIGCRCA